MTRAAKDPRMVARAESLRSANWSYARIAGALSTEFSTRVGQSTVRDWVTYGTRQAPPSTTEVAPRGFVAVSCDLAASCRDLAREFFNQKADEGFNGDLVDVNPLSWVPKLENAWSLFPVAELRPFRLQFDRSRPEAHVVATAGVDPHEDNALGLTLCWTLHNDRLVFRQKGFRIQPRAGEWFVFDDRLPHEMRSAPGRAVFLGVTVALRPH